VSRLKILAEFTAKNVTINYIIYID